MARPGIPLLVCSLVVAMGVDCTLEDEGRVPLAPPGPDPCTDGALNLNDGIQDGDEAVAAFACLNRTGELDALAPLMATLNTTLSSDGERSLLDVWVDAWHATRSLEVSAGTRAAAKLDQAIAALEEPWVNGTLQLIGDALEAGVGEPLIELQGHYASAYLAMKLRHRETYEAYFPMLGDYLCPGWPDTGICTGPARRFYDGLQSMDDAEGPVLDACQVGAGLSTAQALADAFPPGEQGDIAATTEAVARALADLGESPLLTDGLSRIYPELYGDDPRTEVPEPGYLLHDADRSALYSVLSRFSTDSGLAMLDTYFHSDVAIQTHCYLYAPDTPEGYLAIDRHEATCMPGRGPFALANPATSGVAQMLRLIKAVDVDVSDETLRGMLLDAFTEVAGMEYELSGSNNLAVLILEFFAQLPKETVIYLVEMAAGNPKGLATFNALYGTHVQLDDMQSLKAAVEDEDINGGVGLFLELIQAINTASQPNGVGGLGTFKDLLVEWYDTGFWEDFYPYFLAQVAGPDTGGTSDSDFIDTFQSLAPGGSYHDTVTQPFLEWLYSMKGQPLRTFAAPVAAGLRASEPAMADLFAALGRLGRITLEHQQAAPSEPTGLDCLPTLRAKLAARSDGGDPLTTLAALLHQPALIDAWVETLSQPAVREALVSPGPDGQPSPLQALSRAIADGTLGHLLRTLQGLLLELDTGAAPEDAIGH